MKRTAMVKLGLTSAIAAALTACAKQQAARCVDYTDRVVDEKYCGEMERNRGSGFSTGYYPYRWYYGGAGYALGARALGGSYVRPSGNGSSGGSSSAGGTSRGGFGSTAAGSGAGE